MALYNVSRKSIHNFNGTLKEQKSGVCKVCGKHVDATSEDYGRICGEIYHKQCYVNSKKKN